MTTELEPLLLLLEPLVLQSMSSLVFKVLDSPLLCHDRPTTSLLKEGPGLYQLTPDTAPRPGLPGSPVGSVPGAGQLWNQHHSTLHKALQHLGGQHPL